MSSSEKLHPVFSTTETKRPTLHPVPHPLPRMSLVSASGAPHPLTISPRLSFPPPAFLPATPIFLRSPSPSLCTLRPRRHRPPTENLYPDVDPPEPAPKPALSPPPNQRQDVPGDNILSRARRLFTPRASPSSDSPPPPATPTQGSYLDSISARNSARVTVPEAVPNASPEKASWFGRRPTAADDLDVAASSSGGGIAAVSAEADFSIDIARCSRALWKVGWWSWWAQLILTSVAFVIVAFALVLPGVNAGGAASSGGVIAAAAGVALAAVALVQTYGYTRLAVRVRRGEDAFIKRAPARLASYFRAALVVGVVGMAVSLVGLQAIVGALLARLFGAGIATTPYTTLQSQGVLGGVAAVQPVDVLVVQASANAMSALLFAILTSIWFKGRLRSWTKNSGKAE